MLQTAPTQIARFEIRFKSLFREGRALSFPCNSEGHVDLDAISERAKTSFLFARAMVGLEYAIPIVNALSV